MRDGEFVETKPLDKFSLTASNEIGDLVERQTLIIKRDIRTSTLAQLYVALMVCELVEQCGILVRIIKTEDYLLNGLREEKHEDLTLLLAYSKQLCLLGDLIMDFELRVIFSGFDFS